jgi:hypothetical protein
MIQTARPLRLNYVGVLKTDIFTGTEIRLRNFVSVPRALMDIPATLILLEG